MALGREHPVRVWLSREGVWGEFCQVRKELKEKGLADGTAEKLAVQKFVPAGVLATLDAGFCGGGDQGGGGSGEGAASDVWEGKPDAGMLEIVRWVFDKIAVEGVRPEDAPSAGAWALLKEVKENAKLRADFYLTVMPKLLPTKKELDAEEAGRDDGRVVEMVVKELERLGEAV